MSVEYNVISCDQSFLNFACVVFSPDKTVKEVAVFHTGEINKSNQDKLYGEYFNSIQQQLLYLYDEFEKLVERNRPCKLVFEGLAFGAKGDRVFSLGGLFYFMTTSLIKNNLIAVKDIITITPTKVKKVARDCFEGDDQYAKDNLGNVVFLKNKKPKLKKMDKGDMYDALMKTPDKWITDGFSSYSKKIPTGIKDIPDAYFIGKSYFESLEET